MINRMTARAKQKGPSLSQNQYVCIQRRLTDEPVELTDNIQWTDNIKRQCTVTYNYTRTVGQKKKI